MEKLRVPEMVPDRLKRVGDKELLAVNRRLHQLFSANFADNDKTTVGDLNREDLVNAALFVWAEMERRDMEVAEDSPLREAAFALVKIDKPRRGLIISPRRYAMATISGDRTLLVKPKPADLSGRWLLLSEKKALGVIELHQRQELSFDEFKKRVKEHLVTEETRQLWAKEWKSWGGEHKFWGWEIEVLERYDEPLETDAPNGSQSTVRDVKVIEKKVEFPGNVVRSLDELRDYLSKRRKKTSEG
jgi:hypothetical protein